MGLTLANHFSEDVRNVSVFLDVNGANLASNTPKTNLNETSPLIEKFIDNKGHVYVCSECLKMQVILQQMFLVELKL